MAGPSGPAFGGPKDKLVPAIPIHETQRMKQFYVYILASRPGGAIYVGVTSDLARRIYEHKNGLADGFTKRYRIDRLGLLRELFVGARRNPAREKYQTLVAGLEDKNDRNNKSVLARFVRRHSGTCLTHA
jgi:predicted GIY-YIG superfamily endonuclease